MVAANNEKTAAVIKIKDTLYLDEFIQTLLKSGYWVKVDKNNDESVLVYVAENK